MSYPEFLVQHRMSGIPGTEEWAVFDMRCVFSDGALWAQLFQGSPPANPASKIERHKSNIKNQEGGLLKQHKKSCNFHLTFRPPDPISRRLASDSHGPCDNEQFHAKWKSAFFFSSKKEQKLSSGGFSDNR